MHLFLFTKCIGYRYLLLNEGELFLQDFWSKKMRRKYLAYGQHLNWSLKDKKAEYLSELLGQHSATSLYTPWVLKPLLMCFLIYCLCKNNEVDVCGEEPAWPAALPDLFSFTPSHRVLTRSRPWDGRSDGILCPIQQVSPGALSLDLSACCCLCFRASLLPPSPVGCWAAAAASSVSSGALGTD